MKVRLKAADYKHLLRAKGGGSFNRLEFDNDWVVLRTVLVKEATGILNIFFDSKRDQIKSGIAYDGISGGKVMRLRYGTWYKVLTHVEIIKPIPEDVVGKIKIAPNMWESFLLLDNIFLTKGFKGNVEFLVNVVRSTMMESLTTIAQLGFFKKIDDEKEKIDDMTITTKMKSKKKKNNKKELKEDDIVIDSVENIKTIEENKE